MMMNEVNSSLPNNLHLDWKFIIQTLDISSSSHCWTDHYECHWIYSGANSSDRQVSIYHLSSHAEVEYVDKLTFYMMVVSAVAIRWGLRLVPVLVLCSHVNGKLILANKRHTTNN